MRTLLRIAGIGSAILAAVSALYGFLEFGSVPDGNTFDHIGRATVAFLVAFGCAKLVRVIQQRINQIDAIENPRALRSRLMREASDRLGDLSNTDDQKAQQMIEKEVEWIQEEVEKARQAAERKHQPRSIPPA